MNEHTSKRKYVPPTCGIRSVVETVPAWPDFFGWRCAKCNGPLRLGELGAAIFTTGKDDPFATERSIFLHDTKSDFYWVTS